MADGVTTVLVFSLLQGNTVVDQTKELKELQLKFGLELKILLANRENR